VASLFGVEELYEQAVVVLADTYDCPLDHKWGEVHTKRYGVPNSYVWVPTKTRDFDKAIGRGGATENRALFGTQEIFEIHCWGQSHEIAFLMRSNVAHAMKKAIGGPAPLHHLGSEWIFDLEDENTLGHLLVATFAFDAQIMDEFVQLARYIRNTPQSPTAAATPNTLIETVVVSTYKSPNTTTDGTLVAVDTIEDP
jgi:hypothetical protein